MKKLGHSLLVKVQQKGRSGLDSKKVLDGLIKPGSVRDIDILGRTETYDFLTCQRLANDMTHDKLWLIKLYSVSSNIALE